MYSPGIRICSLFIYLYQLSVFVYLVNGATDCAKHKQEWYNIRYTSMGANIMPSDPGSRVDAICPVSDGPSCCDHRMEREMYAVAHRLLMRQTDMSFARVADQLANDSAALEAFLRTNVEQTRDRSHEFFSHIYGYNYKAHKRFFLQFFADLDAYVVGQRNQLGQLIDNFFHQLRDSIIALIERSGQIRSGPGLFPDNQRGSGTSGASDETGETRRLHCLSERMAQLRPFDDVDVQLKRALMDAYPPARMLVNTMLSGSRLLSRLAKQISNKPECILGVARVQLCAVCASKSLTSVCPDSCPKLMSACLPAQSPNSPQLTAIWPRLIDAILRTAVRLERSSNFPAVNRRLQMEISDAITSLQTRYEQTKSKLESECRMGSSGRSGPSLFTSPGSSNRAAQSADPFAANPSIDWSMASSPRRKRTPRQLPGRSPASSADLLDWQTRSRNAPQPVGSPQSWQNNPYGPRRDDMFGSQLQQQLQRQPQTRPNWASGPVEAPANTQHSTDNLSHLTARVKRMYSTMKHLFGGSESNVVCPSTQPNHTSNSTDCWTPPELSSSTPDPGIEDTLRLLAEAADRLIQATGENADPDVLLVLEANNNLPSEVGLRSSMSRMSGFQDSSSRLLDTQDNRQQPSQANMWGNQAGPDQFGAYNSPDTAMGSGAGEPDWNPDLAQPPPPSSMSNPQAGAPSQFFGPTQPLGPHPSPGSYPFPDDRSIPGSGDGDYPTGSSPDGNYAWPPPPPSSNAQPPTGLGEEINPQPPPYPDSPYGPPVVQPPPHVTSAVPIPTDITTHATPSSVSSSTPSTTVGTPTDPVQIEREDQHPETLEPEISVAKDVTSSTVAPVQENSPSHVPKEDDPVTTSTTTTTEIPLDTTTQRTTHQPQPHLFSEPPPFNGLPDDEDTMLQPGRNEYEHMPSPSTHGRNQPPWSGTDGALNERGPWAQPPGTGMSEMDRGSHPGSSGVDMLSPDRGEPPESMLPSYYSPGSGQGPDPAISGPQPGLDVPPEASQPELPPPPPPRGQSGWSNPSQPFAVGAEGSGAPIDDENTAWQVQGSGQYEPVTPIASAPEPPPAAIPPFNYPNIDPRVNPTLNQPPTTVKPRPAVNPMFLPPPEIWIPAHLGGEQRVPSVLLVREYNLQDPFYHADHMQRRPSNHAHRPSLSVGPIQLICAMLLLRLP